LTFVSGQNVEIQLLSWTYLDIPNFPTLTEPGLYPLNKSNIIWLSPNTCSEHLGKPCKGAVTTGPIKGVNIIFDILDLGILEFNKTRRAKKVKVDSIGLADKREKEGFSTTYLIN
jgi:hypothetical protein